MKQLKHRQNVLDHKIEALEGDMLSITKETFEELDYLKRKLELTGYNIKVLTTEIKNVQYKLSRHMERIMDNSNSILFLSSTISVLLSEMERYLALHERVKSELDHILDALDNLSNNLLSHSVVRPSVLKRMIKHVKQQVAEKYTNYELVITEVHDYYNLPVSSFDYVDGILGVFVPLFIRPNLQDPMYVYNVRTIPVPYHINSEMIDETESEKAYTQIIPDTEMVAMNRDTYINVDHSELKQCIKFSVMYFCDQTFLMKHTSEHTCETAIYHEQSPDLIKDKCNIQYYPELDPTPQILATVNKITASIKTILTATLPAVTQAAVISNEDVELQINNIDILIYAIQMIIIMAVFIVTIWLCIHIWNCINTRNLGRLQEKLTFMKFLYADKTDLYMQFMSNYMTWSVYLGSVYDNPEGIEAVGQLQMMTLLYIKDVYLIF